MMPSTVTNVPMVSYGPVTRLISSSIVAIALTGSAGSTAATAARAVGAKLSGTPAVRTTTVIVRRGC